LISYAFETYLGLVIIAIIFSYYYSKEFPIEPVIESPISQQPAEEESTIQNTEEKMQDT
jgi:hypothetical protein